MSVSELAHVGTEGGAGVRFAHWVAVRRCALGLYFVALGAWSAEYGIPVQRELVIAWTCGALACASVGRPPGEIWRLLLDWSPVVLVFAAYDFSRGAADTLGMQVQAAPMIEFDRFLFAGDTPTQWMQEHVNAPGVVNGWDVAFTLVYTSYFIVPFAVAGALWIRDRLEYLRYAKRLVTLAVAGLATYILFPAMPPWLANDSGLLDGVSRTTSEGWEVLGGGTAGLFSKGQASVNLVAAVPSLHAGFTALVAFFLWGRVRRRWLRPLLLLYPLAMGVTLIATGEHYFFDIALGYLYAGAVMAGWALWERRRRSPAAGPDQPLRLGA